MSAGGRRSHGGAGPAPAAPGENEARRAQGDRRQAEQHALPGRAAARLGQVGRLAVAGPGGARVVGWDVGQVWVGVGVGVGVGVTVAFPVTCAVTT